MARKIDLQFPQGVERRLGYRATSKSRGGYPTPWAMNVRLRDSLTDRMRGGSFTGISAASRSAPVYRGRKLTFSGRAVTASRVGIHGDIDMGADVTDSMRPALFQFSEAGSQGSAVVALVPHKDRYLLGFMADELWVQSGDPLNGTRQRVSDQVGIIGANAWCVAHDTVYFLSSHGLYSVNADGGGLKPLSEGVLPEDLTDVTDSTCTLTYQHADRGVYIHKSGTNWYYDIERDEFWPFDTDTTDSHILIGPFRLGSTDMLGMIQAMHGIMAEGSDTVTWHIVPGDTAEQSAENGKAAITSSLAGTTTWINYVNGSGAWSAGRSQTARPRVTTMWATLWLHCEGDWAYEGISVTLVPAGAWRK